MASKKTNRDDQKLRDYVVKVIHQRRKQLRISPAWVATETMVKIGATTHDRRKKPFVYQAAHMYLRQIAREMLRTMFGGGSNFTDDEQHELYPDLQARYPIAHGDGDEPQYARLETLTYEDWLYNRNRMEREIATKQKHFLSFEAWGLKRFPEATRAA